MSITDIVFLCGICGGFVVFATILAWGDHQTRNMSRDRTQKPQVAAPPGLQISKGAEISKTERSLAA